MPSHTAAQPSMGDPHVVLAPDPAESDPKLDSSSLALLKKYQNLKLELLQMHNLLDSKFTPGHDALMAKCERAEARSKIAGADLNAAMAKEESARAEVLVIKAQLDNERKTRAAVQGLLNDKTKEGDRLRRRIKDLSITEKSSKQKHRELETKAKDSARKLVDLQRKLAEEKEKFKTTEAKLKKSVTAEKKIEAKAEKLDRLNNATRTACKALEKRLKEERATAKEKEKNIQKRLDIELQRVKTLEEDRNSWKRQAEMTGRRLRIEEDRTTKLEVYRAYTLPPAPALMDGNNAALLSPAPLARASQLAPPSPASESKSRFTSLPFPGDEDSIVVPESPVRIGATVRATGEIQASTPKRGRSAGLSKRNVEDQPPKKKGKPVRRVPDNESRSFVGDERKKVRQKRVNESDVPMLQERPSKRQKLEKETKPDKRGAKTKRAASGKLGKTGVSESAVERRAGGRTLRSRRPVSYDYNQAGRDIADSLPGFEVDESALRPTRAKRTKKPPVVKRLVLDEEGDEEIRSGRRRLRVA